MSRRLIVAFAAAALAACEAPEGEVTAEVAAAADAVTHTIEAARPIRVAFDFLGQLPEWQPGQSRQEYADLASESLKQVLDCALQERSSTDSADTLALRLPANGCLVGAHGLAGVIAFTITGGDDCLAAQVDLAETELDSFTVGSRASHARCADGSALWSAQAQGELAQGVTYDLQGTIAVQGADGGVFSEGSTQVIDGHCILDLPDGRWAVEVDRFTYTAGDLSPHQGVVRLAHPEHQIRATLARKTEPLERTEATIVVDDDEPAVVLLP